MTDGQSAEAADRITLSICIPTYNRAALLRRCLQRVVPQLAGRSAEVVILDNASPDDTQEVAREFASPVVRYIRNSSNLGYTGNQEKCLLEGRGEYTAILCDDDVYEPGAVERILDALNLGPFSFVAINYFGFEGTPENVTNPSAGPSTQDFKADDAYDVLDYPSVGHYSGYIVRTEVVRAVLPEVKELYPRERFEQHRGILGPAVIFAVKRSHLPGYYIGAPIMGAGRPEEIDYDGLGHICMDTYRSLYDMKKMGVLTQANIARREEEILRMLPKSVMRDGGFYSGAEIAAMRAELDTWFRDDPRFGPTAFRLSLMRFAGVRFLTRLAVRFYLSRRAKKS
jgi:glycosyltransferase involved in cell wall biosynthesis